MFDSDVKDIGYDVEKLVKRVNNLNINDDVYQVKDEIEQLEQMYNDLSNKMDECDNDLKESSDSNTKPLINKLSQFRSDLDIAKNKLNEKKNLWKPKYNLELLSGGQLEGVEKKKVTREVIMDQHKETDYQGDLITGIGESIKGANQNLVGITTELKDQGDQIVNTQGIAKNTEGIADNTGKVLTKMERRQTCAKVVGIIGIVIVGLADAAILIVKLIQR